MAALITLVQEVWFGGVGFYKSSLVVLMVAGFFTFLSAVAGGLVAALIAKSHSRIHALVMCILIVAEAIALIVTGGSADPFWFDILASSSLIIGILLGAFLHERLRTNLDNRVLTTSAN
ncbi:hypothetical protein IH824_11885 [candidate division KSB1 bacterium]|nr:hypothetical protein [candidate division KSB1 bacterium]